MTGDPPRLAVLIDGDNIPADSMERLFATIETLGDAVVRKVYGGSQLASKKWAEAFEAYALSLGRKYPNWVGRNASDIEMVIGAMDLLAENRVDGFCIVSSDGDFTPLALRLREAGKVVYGCGHSAPEDFRNACHQFFVMARASLPDGNGNLIPFARSGIEFAAATMRRLVTKHAGNDGWMELSSIGTKIGGEIPGFAIRQYGVPTLKKLAEKAGCFEVAENDRGDTILRVRPTNGAD